MDELKHIRRLKLGMMGVRNLSSYEENTIDTIRKYINEMEIHRSTDKDIVCLVHDGNIFFEYDIRNKRTFMLKWLYDELYYGPNYIDPKIIISVLLDQHFKSLGYDTKNLHDRVFTIRVSCDIGEEITHDFFKYIVL